MTKQGPAKLAEVLKGKNAAIVNRFIQGAPSSEVMRDAGQDTPDGVAPYAQPAQPDAYAPNDGSEEAEANSPAPVIESEEALRGAIESVKTSAELTYADMLAKHNISQDTADEIIDALISKGYYQKTYRLLGKYPVTFRSRNMVDQDNILARIEREAPKYGTTISNMVAKYNLAASLVSFRDIRFSKMVMTERIKTIDRMPSTVVRMLSKMLGEFDELLVTVLSHGAVENF